MCTGAVGDVSQRCNLEIESAALGSAKSCRSSRWEFSEHFHNELVMFSLYQEPMFVLAMNGKSISIVEFPKVDACVGRSDTNRGWTLKESHTYEKRPT
jgi:hypothetical protein